MGDDLNPDSPRGLASTSLWSAECKDCRAEQAAQTLRRGTNNARGGGKSSGSGGASSSFEYAGSWARSKLNRGESRSDRCERHRRSHASAISAFAVPYVDLRVIGEVADPSCPSGPLGGLGPLPVLHREAAFATDLASHPFGMTDSHILTLLNGLAGKKRVAVVEAGTGTGKSTFMPFRLMNPPEGAAYLPTDFGPIIVTEPRRAAATSVARFVSEDLCYGCDCRKCSRHVGPGFQVGYQVSGERHWDAACELIYVTDGTMINWVRDGQLARISMVIIDEVHERSENIDILLAQLRELLRQHEHLRVIITSATLDRDFFISYFGGPEHVFEHNVAAPKSFGYGTPLFINTEIDEEVLESGLEIAPDVRFSGWHQDAPPEPGSDDMKKTTLTLEKLRCVDEIPVAKWTRAMPEAVVKQVVKIARGTGWGDILAFLPTSDTIQRTVNRIRDELSELDLDFDVYPLLSSTPPAITEKALAARSRSQKRKIVISSNLAETSLTVKGVRYVVDSGLICQEECDSELATSSFPTKPHSQSALRQRWGRVGRDMPGWVFPLYTTEQFLSLARNTPPETSQKNLESYYMKLLSSGLDPDLVLLPGSHVPEGADVDNAGREYVEQFKRESQRARRALALAGAIDAVGHLTEFGRDMELFPGDGSNALAIMLADQLACAHEVILALTVLGEGQLIGTRTEAGKTDFILAIDEAWPAAWRVRAAQAHRGLAFGCRDELDVLLRVVALYQAAPDALAWCARWWVNASMIESAIETMKDEIDVLSAAMKEGAERPIHPELGGRARAVLSRALVSARYQRAPDGTYLPVNGVDTEPAKLGGNVIVGAPERIIALNRFRRGRPRDDGTPRPAEISHIVEFLPWAAVSDVSAEDLGLDLIARAAEHPSLWNKAEENLTLGVFDAAPIGAIYDFDIGRIGNVLEMKAIASPFTCPVVGVKTSSVRARDRVGAGFDREWEPKRESLGEVPEEERALEILKAQEDEVNDELEPKYTSPPQSISTTGFSGKLFVRTSAGQVNKREQRGIVVGYAKDSDDNIILHIDSIEKDFLPTDPAAHADLLPWEELTVTVVGLTRDHQTSFTQLDRADGRGSFYLPDRGTGLDSYDRGMIARLKHGAHLTARAVPVGTESMSVTLLTAARALLGAAKVDTRPRGDERLRVFPALVVHGLDESGWATVEIEERDDATGLSFRFRVHRRDLSTLGLADPLEGAKLLVGLRPAREGARKESAEDLSEGGRTKRFSTLRVPDEEVAKVAASESTLEVNGRSIRAGKRDIPFATIARLIEASPDQSWRNAVWEFYEQSLHLSVAAVYPPSPYVELPVRIASLVHFRVKELEARWGVTLYVRRSDASVGISSTDPVSALRASRELQALADMPRLSVHIGDAKVGSRAVEARRDVSYVWIENGVATIAGASSRAVEEAMRQMVKPARGEITVPQDWIGRFMGKDAINLKSFQAGSGCDAYSPLKNGRWELRAPAGSNIEMFLTLAKQKIPAAVGSLLARGELAVVPDPPRPSPQGPIAAWRRENPGFFANVTLSELEQLTGMKSQIRPIVAAPTAPAGPIPKPAPRIAKMAPTSSTTKPRTADNVVPIRGTPAASEESTPGFLASFFRKFFD